MIRVHPSIKALHPERFLAITCKNRYEYYGAQKLPEAYKKFYNEWTDEASSTPVHWVPRTENWERNPETGEVTVIQNWPIPVLYPHQMHHGIWGGEGVIKGSIKKGKWRSPVPRFWVPRLQESVVYSEVLDKYLEVTVTERALRLIDHHCGLDNYLLQSPANDLKSFLALKIKRKILLALLDKDFAHANPEKQEELYNKYKQYMIPREEAEWYGLTFHEAKAKWELIQKSDILSKVVPLKIQYREELLQKLAYEKNNPVPEPEKKSWATKLNPFSRPPGYVEPTVPKET